MQSVFVNGVQSPLQIFIMLSFTQKHTYFCHIPGYKARTHYKTQKVANKELLIY